MFAKDSGLLQGTVELLILKTLSWGPMHGYGIASWIESATDDVLRVEEGSLYPALYRMTRKGRIQAYVASGMTPDAARRKALERFGDVKGVREECAQLLTEDRKAEARRDWFGDLAQDVHFALRSGVRAPLFSLMAIATLALGIG